jgi:nucleoside-diphosphate-sugar epimerase
MILITGCAGYIGRHLARALRADGLAVRGLDRDRVGLASLEALGVEPVAADVGNVDALIAALRGVKVVYHLAGSALGTPAEIARGNFEGTRTVALACASKPELRALVFASSGALYPSGDGWLSEETPPAPAFHYARAKAAAEGVLLRVHAAVGLPAVIARIAAVYGPASPALMIEQVRRGRFPLIGGGRGYASNIHIDDAVAALRALAEVGRPGQAYNLADDEPAPIRAFYGELARLLGGPPPPSIAPAAARALVWAVGAAARLRGRPAPLPPDLADMAAVSHRMCNRRMRQELGVTPRYPSYIDGLPTCVGAAPVPR